MPSLNLFPANAGDSQNKDTRKLDDSSDEITEDRVSSVLVPDLAKRGSQQILSLPVEGCSELIQPSPTAVEEASSVPCGTVSISAPCGTVSATA